METQANGKTPNLAQLQKAVKDNTFKLPSIADIYAATDTMPTLQQDSVIQVLLNQPPQEQWLKDHPTAKKEVIINGQKQRVPIKYIPIERIEWLLTNIFVRWKVEIKWSKLVANSVEVAVRLHVYDHILEDWSWQDGIGAQPLQTDQGAGATDFDKIKSNAVQIALPAAESYAVKDAAEKLGKLFGKDVNRAESNISYESLAKKYENVMD
jgi:hypothetical protein